MLQRADVFQLARTVLRLSINVALTLIIILLSLSIKNPALPKSIAYSFVRETAKKDIEFRTRDWNSLRDKKFLIKYQDQDANRIDLVLDTIKMDFEEVNKILDYSNEGKVPIIIYPNGESLGKSFGWDADESAMGVYWAGVIRILSPNEWLDDEISHDIAMEKFRKNGPMVHEYTHLVVDYRTRGNYTRWFTEGIAQLIEKRITGFQFDNVASRTEKSDWYDLKYMDRDFDGLPNQALAYSQSLLMIELLVEHHGYQGLNAILTHLGTGKTLNKSFQLVTGKTLIQFERSI